MNITNEQEWPAEQHASLWVDMKNGIFSRVSQSQSHLREESWLPGQQVLNWDTLCNRRQVRLNFQGRRGMPVI